MLTKNMRTTIKRRVSQHGAIDNRHCSFMKALPFRYYTGVKTEGGSYREQSLNISFYVWGVAIWNNFVKDLLKTKGAL